MKEMKEMMYPIAVDVKGLMALVGVGRNTAMRIGQEAGAVIRLSPRRTLYNVEKVKAYLDSLTK